MTTFARVRRVALRITLVAAFSVVGAGAEQNWLRLASRSETPTARQRHSAVYEPRSHRMIVFGGQSRQGEECASLNDAWILTNPSGTFGPPSWTALDVDGPRPAERHSHSSVYDAKTDRLMVFGGQRDDRCQPLPSGHVLNDVWILESASGRSGRPVWHELTPAGAPPAPRESHAAVYDERRNRMLVFGGTTLPGSCAGSLNDVWALSHANGEGGTPEWTRLHATGAAPSARRGHSAVYDPSTDRTIVFGGESGCRGEVSDVVALAHGGSPEAHGTWSRIATGGPTPPPRSFHAAVYDATSNRMTIVGGQHRETTLDDAWVLSSANGQGDVGRWTKTAAGDVIPSPRAGHTAILDVASQRVVMFGGSSTQAANAAPMNDAWTLRDGLLIDTAPPAIMRVTAEPAAIVYASRRLVPVAISVSVADEYDRKPRCEVASVKANESPRGAGTDAVVDGLKVALRAERPRRPGDEWRRYTLTVRCTDRAGNSGSTTIDVPVRPPKDLAPRLVASIGG
jgi:hypothetical protein